jgi:methylenetetrahydrofolate dehydrogenase (NADP+)/methenyltetrahydrofolate cyclohydrolase
MLLLDGKKLADELKTEIAAEVLAMKTNGKKIPHLAAILVGTDGGSLTYVGHKVKACEQAGIQSTLLHFDDSVSEDFLLNEVKKLNENNEIDGFIVQLPLPKHINADKVTMTISPDKDVDGFHPVNVGKVTLGMDAYVSATPLGITKILERYQIETAGKHCVVIGRSNIVGRPMSILMSNQSKTGNATVTVCHSRTKNMKEICLQADIIIAALGKPGFLTADMVKEGAVIIDVGTTRVSDTTSKAGWRLKGDVKFEEVAAKCSAITPVPGGVGPMTVVSLLLNTLKAAKMKQTLLLFFIAALAVLSSCNQSQKKNTDTFTTPSGKNIFTDSASSSVKVFNDNGKICIQQSSTSYQMVDAYEGSLRVPLLLKIKKTELCFADSANKHKVYEVSAKSVMDTKTVEWSNEFVATEIEFKDNTLYAIHEGTEGEEDFIKRFSLLNGKEVFSCSYADLKVNIPNVKGKQFVGYTSRRAATNPLGEIQEENLLGVIRLGSSTDLLQSVKVKLKRSSAASKIPTTTPDMIFLVLNENTTAIEDGKSIILMKADEHYQQKDVKDFSLKLTFYYGDDNEATNIIIPVNNDTFNLSGAQYDKDIFELLPF